MNRIGLAIIVAAVALGSTTFAISAHRAEAIALEAALAAQTQAQAQAQAQAKDMPRGNDMLSNMGGMLMKGLAETPGCLATDAGQWNSGKNTIIAWFENKKAVTDWYYSPTHAGMMRAAGGGMGEGKPLAHVADDEGPIMVMATLTIAEKPAFENLQMPVSQISIELFKPLPGGAFLGERLAPESFEVPHMRDLTPPK